MLAARVWMFSYRLRLLLRFLMLVSALLFLLLLLLPVLESEEKTCVDEFVLHSASPVVRPEEITAVLEPSRCTDKNTRLLMVVLSAPANRDHRNAIRATWGRQATDITRLVFLMGLNSSIEGDVIEESKEHGDILLEDFVDSYQNLTIKTLFLLKWALSPCAHHATHVLKIDDDVLLNVRGLLGSLTNASMVGHLMRNKKPIRSQRSKWYLGHCEYPKRRLPLFLAGPAYILHRKVLEPLFITALELPLIHLEDVFLTGIVAEKLGIPRVNDRRIVNTRPTFSKPCLLRGYIAVHEYSPDEIVDLWTKLVTQNSTKNCGWFDKLMQLISSHSTLPESMWA